MFVALYNYISEIFTDKCTYQRYILRIILPILQVSEMQDQFHKTEYKIRGLMQNEVATGFNRYQDVFTLLNKEFTTFKNDIIYEKIAKVHFQSYLGPDSNLLGPIRWQYRLWSFQTGYIKLERFLPKNQHA